MSTTGSAVAVTTSAGLRGPTGATGAQGPPGIATAFTATQTAVVNMNALSADNIMPWDTEIIKDVGFTHDNVTDNSRVVCGFTGRIRVVARISQIGTGVATRHVPRVHLRLNGDTSVPGAMHGSYARGSDGADESTTIGDWLIDVTAGDYLEILIDRATVATDAMNTLAGESMLILERRL